MPLPDNLKKLIEKNAGFLTTGDANRINISNERLCLLVREGELERVAYGVYSPPGELSDKMYLLKLQKPKIIFSHETALFLHDLTDRDPLNYVVTVPTGYNSNSLKKENVKVFSVKSCLHNVGRATLETPFGNSVYAYNMERTICDCIRSRNRMDASIINDALKRYVNRRDKDLNMLMDFAEQFSVSKVIRGYMEVLL